MNYPLNSLWDISQAPAQFSQLPDDDFLALLQKQFSTANANTSTTAAKQNSVNPQSTQPRRESPPSDDSSPSPPSNTDAASRRQSLHARQNDTEDASLKRKASGDDMAAGPSSKNQHTDDDPNSAKKTMPIRRRSTGNPLQDESRLIKRKEQNRAAQRAFRERKEKHVKDLEDKVAALEAKNEATEAENTNLRDLLSHLQEENLALKQGQFTFSVPKGPSIPASTPSANSQPPSFNFFNSPSTFPPPTAPSQAPKSPAFSTDIDWNALTTFDPSVLSMLDEPQEVPMQVDPATSPFGQYALPPSFKTIVNNPLLMSFADESPSSASTATSPASAFDPMTFSFPSPTNSWSSTAQPTPLPQNGAHGDFLHPNHSLDELFGGNFMATQGPLDFNALVDSTSMSPITHATNGAKPIPPTQKPVSSPLLNSSTSSPNSSSSSQSPFSWTSLSQPGESPPSASESTPSNLNSGTQACVPILISRADVAKRIAAEGPSPFTDVPNPLIRKTPSGDMVSCQGSNFPRTQESPDNIEVLKAWRCITQNPHFRDADINELCAEFSKKARCDGTKVVLEPEGVQQLFEKFKKLQQPIPMQQSSSDHPSS